MIKVYITVSESVLNNVYLKGLMKAAYLNIIIIYVSII